MRTRERGGGGEGEGRVYRLEGGEERKWNEPKPAATVDLLGGPAVDPHQAVSQHLAMSQGNFKKLKLKSDPERQRDATCGVLRVAGCIEGWATRQPTTFSYGQPPTTLDPHVANSSLPSSQPLHVPPPAAHKTPAANKRHDHSRPLL